jgi:hypothetical protein
MDKLNKDELYRLALEFDMFQLLEFCKLNKRFYEKVCKQDDIWYYRLSKDFPDYKLLKIEISPIEKYKLLFFFNKSQKIFEER